MTGSGGAPDHVSATEGAPARLTAAQRTLDRGAIDRGRLAWLASGAAALFLGTVLGWSGGVLDLLAGPPPIVRAGLVAAATVAGLALLREAVRRLSDGRRVPVAELHDADIALLIRAVRLVFLSVAAFSAAAGWLLAHPLPFVVALVIAGVDVLETSLLLLVVALRREP